MLSMEIFGLSSSSSVIKDITPSKRVALNNILANLKALEQEQYPKRRYPASQEMMDFIYMLRDKYKLIVTPSNNR
jgi:hypothetical protein